MVFSISSSKIAESKSRDSSLARGVIVGTVNYKVPNLGLFVNSRNEKFKVKIEGFTNIFYSRPDNPYHREWTPRRVNKVRKVVFKGWSPIKPGLIVWGEINGDSFIIKKFSKPLIKLK